MLPHRKNTTRTATETAVRYIEKWRLFCITYEKFKQLLFFFFLVYYICIIYFAVYYICLCLKNQNMSLSMYKILTRWLPEYDRCFSTKNAFHTELIFWKLLLCTKFIILQLSKIHIFWLDHYDLDYIGIIIILILGWEVLVTHVVQNE
jgi:hypothetical protein